MRRGLLPLLTLLLLTSALPGCLTANQDAVNPVSPGATAGGFSGTDVFPGDYDTSGPFARTLEEGRYEPLEHQEYKLTSALDGADIHLSVRLPDVPAGTRVPIVVLASPYLFSGLEASWEQHPVARHADNLIPHGYAFALVAVRGTSDSGGCSDLWGARERADLDQAITWLGTRDWSNGNVGMIGLSYEGTTPWVVAATGNPHLKTIVPMGGLTDPFDIIWRNGTVKTLYTDLARLFYVNNGFAAYNPATGERSAEHTLESAVCPEAWKGIVASGESSITGEMDALGYWAERNQRPGVLENYTGSVLLVHGLQDWNVVPSQAYPFVNRLQEEGVVVKHLLGQWGHSWPDHDANRNPFPRWDWAEIMLRWFDYWLKGDAAVDLGPAAQVQDSAGQWRSESTWPPADATPTRFHLATNERLVTEQPAQEESILVGPPVVVPDVARIVQAGVFTNSTIELWDEPAAMVCPACATFRTQPLEEPLRFAGLPRVHVTVTPHGPGGQLTAYLLAVDANETVKRLGWGAIDLRFADGTREAQDVPPGEPLQVKLQLEPVDAVVAPGSRLVLQIHQGGYGDNHLPARTPFPFDVEVGGEKSALTLDTFERGAEAFFHPPGVDA